ncbi:hypothetical protein ZOSMA_30G01050 [Zostera marina]|uniref:Uncharacterized protein n=1 Tax=Zostera marina TaxID=29655 RepID=A0A0K9PC87_ZOSMR|nr:hypothetical protein ZOSMA_30G01050 [Zostera marina]
MSNVGVKPAVTFLDSFHASKGSFSTFGFKSVAPSTKPSLSVAAEEKTSNAVTECSSKESVTDFEFLLDDPVAMLPADELFSDGKLVPLHLTSARLRSPVAMLEAADSSGMDIQTMETQQKTKRSEAMASLDPYLFSPKAPRCSSRWRELLGLKKGAAGMKLGDSNKLTSSPSTENQTTRTPTHITRGGVRGGLKHFLHRSQAKSSSRDSSCLSLPLLRGDTELDTVLISARLSLSSSSSSCPDQDHEDLPRFSLDSDKPTHRNPSRLRLSNPQRNSMISQPTQERSSVRLGRSQIQRSKTDVMMPPRGASVDSPRMNSYGKIVFHQSLERSSSSPSTFNGGSKVKLHPREMDRSYSSNVRVAPVLNVPVCSLMSSSKNAFGFGQLFSSPQKKDNGSISAGCHAGSSGKQHRNVRVGV